MATVAPLTANQLMDWAEQQLPDVFPVAGRVSGNLSPYVYRYYPQSGFYLGVSVLAQDVAIYLLYPNGTLARIAALADYTCTVLPQNCSAPGAPTINSITAGDTSASILFAAPGSSGGSAISKYTAACSAQSALMGSGTATFSPVVVQGLQNGTEYSCTVTATNSFGTGLPSLAMTVTPSASGSGTVTSTTTTANVYCGYAASVPNQSTSVNATSTVSITCDSTSRIITGNGLPDHPAGTFPNPDNPHAITAQAVNALMTLTPVTQSGVTNATIVGYAINGIKLDPNTNATCAVSGQTVTCNMNGGGGIWNIEAMGQSKFKLGLDTSNAHVQPSGAYHYHGMPEGLISRIGKGKAMTIVGFAMDGFPIYARYGYTNAQDASSAVKTIVSSWKLKSAPSAGRPPTGDYPMGVFKQDYEYAAGADGLDECNGRFGVTPEFATGIYHYYITDTYPYIPRCVKGEGVRP